MYSRKFSLVLAAALTLSLGQAGARTPSISTSDAGHFDQVSPAYSARGTASWYGGSFHGQRDARGEIFDQNALTAAHRTLPLNSFVQVTNLDNGRVVVVRVTDRGPYAHHRLIDLSRAAARELGFISAGTARVSVRSLDGTPA
ncbi:MAG: septal ring lytic transglycosylase RlpA family protein [Terricaulis sp.]